MLLQAINASALGANAASAAKAQKAGSEFEAILLNMVLGAVERSFSELPGTVLQQEARAYVGLGMQALTSGLARDGGIGIAKMISGALEKTRPGQEAR